MSAAAYEGVGQRVDLGDALAGARVRFWVCPVVEHRRRDAVTVEWTDGVAHCTARGCGRSSADPTGGGCNCDGDNLDGSACTGYCCGPGNCSCSESTAGATYARS